MSAFVLICHTSCLLKFGHQTLNCPSIRYIVPAKIFPALPLYQKNWFCGKVRFDDFYPLLRSTPSPWTHIGVKKISQACCLHHLKNMEKKLKDTILGWKTNRVLFLNHPVFGHKEYTQSFNLDLCFTVLCHCVKCVRIRSYSGPYFSAFSPNVGKYGPE